MHQNRPGAGQLNSTQLSNYKESRLSKENLLVRVRTPAKVSGQTPAMEVPSILRAS